MVVWTGWGIGVVFILAIGLVIGIVGVDALGPQLALDERTAEAAGILIGGFLAAIGIFFFARWRDGGEGRVLVDEKTGERVEVRRSAGSLFFIPTRFWTFIVPVLAGLLAYAMYTTPA